MGRSEDKGNIRIRRSFADAGKPRDINKMLRMGKRSITNEPLDNTDYKLPDTTSNTDDEDLSKTNLDKNVLSDDPPISIRKRSTNDKPTIPAHRRHHSLSLDTSLMRMG